MFDTFYFIVTWFSIGITFAFGLCFLVLRVPSIPALQSYKKAKIAMAFAYVILSILNIVEMITRANEPDIDLTQSITLIMSAFQALLFTCTFITLVNIHFITKRNIFLEVGGIVLLSILLFVTLFVDEKRSYFDLALCLFAVYYIFMLLRYTRVFLKNYRHYIHQVDNFFSEEDTVRLRWIFYSFFVALAVGIGALLLTFSETTLHYILFTILLICLYSYFGIKFIDYAFLFGKIEPVIAEESQQISDDEKVKNVQDAELEAKIAHWVKNDGFTEKGITINQLSQILGTNRTYLSNYLNANYQQTFSVWINNLRIEKAKHLLKEKDELTVTQITEIVGYTDKSNFGRQFTKREGVSPSAWRKSRTN